MKQKWAVAMECSHNSNSLIPNRCVFPLISASLLQVNTLKDALMIRITQKTTRFSSSVLGSGDKDQIYIFIISQYHRSISILSRKREINSMQAEGHWPGHPDSVLRVWCTVGTQWMFYIDLPINRHGNFKEPLQKPKQNNTEWPSCSSVSMDIQINEGKYSPWNTWFKAIGPPFMYGGVFIGVSSKS